MGFVMSKQKPGAGRKCGPFSPRPGAAGCEGPPRGPQKGRGSAGGSRLPVTPPNLLLATLYLPHPWPGVVRPAHVISACPQALTCVVDDEAGVAH